MDNEENSSPSEPTAEATAEQTPEPTTEPIAGAYAAPPPVPESTATAQPVAPASAAAKPTRMWPASTVIAGAIALALFSGLIGGIIGFSVSHHHDRIGLVGYLQGPQQRDFGQQGPFSRNPELQQRLQQFRDNHPGMQGGYPGFPQQSQAPTG